MLPASWSPPGVVQEQYHVPMEKPIFGGSRIWHIACTGHRLLILSTFREDGTHTYHVCIEPLTHLIILWPGIKFLGNVVSI